MGLYERDRDHWLSLMAQLAKILIRCFIQFPVYTVEDLNIDLALNAGERALARLASEPTAPQAAKHFLREGVALWMGAGELLLVQKELPADWRHDAITSILDRAANRIGEAAKVLNERDRSQ